MRFTGPDPAASPFHNLHAYCGNNPAAFCDPDGLFPTTGGLATGPSGLPDPFHGYGDEMMMLGDLVWKLQNLPAEMLIDRVTDVWDGGATYGAEGVLYGKQSMDRYYAQWKRTGRAEQSTIDRVFTVGAYEFGDLFGTTDMCDGMEGRDTFTGESLSTGERWRRGGLGVLKYTGMALGVSSAASTSFTRMSTAPLARGPAVPLARTVPAPRPLRGPKGLSGGNAGERQLAAEVGGVKMRFDNIKVNFRSTRGVKRIREIDSLETGIAHESKVGYVSWSKAKYQILKDAALIRDPASGVNGARWHFYRSAGTGRVGADPRVLRLLNRKGVNYTIYD